MISDSVVDSLFIKELKKEELLDQYGKKNKLPIRKNFLVGDGKTRSVRTRACIRDSATENKLLSISYKKKDGTTEKYSVEPYSYKNVIENGVFVKKLFAWDVKDSRIKSFSVRNILNSEVKEQVFSPRMPILIARNLSDFYKIEHDN